MKIKKILSLCLIAAIVASCLNLVFAEDDVSVISVGKPITSVFYGDGGYNNTTAANANDGKTGTVFYSNASAENEDGLIMNLQKDYKIAYVEVSFSGSAVEHSVILSKTADFSEGCELELKDGKFLLKEEDKDKSFRYAKLSIPTNVAKFRIREFTIYGVGNIVEEPVQIKKLPKFEEKNVNVAFNKKATSKMYNEGGYYSSYSDLTHSADKAVDGIAGDNNDFAFISAYSDDDWLRVDVGNSVRISNLEITAYPQYNGVRVDDIPDWCVVTASNDELNYNEEFYDYVELEEQSPGVWVLPEEHKDKTFRFFQITKPAKIGVLDAMIVREFKVNVDAKEIKTNSALNKPVIYDGNMDYNNALTDGKAVSTVNYESAVIDLLTPSYIKDIVASGENTDGIVYYGGVENSDVSAMKNIAENPNEKYRYIYIDNIAGADISEIEIYTYFSDVISTWNDDEGKNAYSIKVKNGDGAETRNYTAIVSQMDADGRVLTTDSKKINLKGEGEEIIEFSPQYAYGTESVVCNILRDDIIPLTNPTVFTHGEAVKNIINADGIISDSKNLTECAETEGINNGIRIKMKAMDYIENTDIYSIIVYGPDNSIVGFLSENAKDTDAEYEYVARASAPEGRYTATVILTDANSDTFYKNCKFSNVYPTENEIAECIKQFKETDGSNFSELYNAFYVQKRVIDFSVVPIINNQNVLGRIGYVYAWVRDNLLKWSDKTEITSIDDIFACLKAAVIIDSAVNNDVALSDALKLYSEIMSKIFTEDYNTIAQLYKFTDTDYEKILNNFILCNALSAIKNKPVTKIAEALKNYSNVLKVDINKINQRKIDIYEIAKRIDNTVPESYYDGLGSEVEALIMQLTPNSKPQSSGGGGGGGTGGSGATAVSPNVNIPATIEPVIKEEQKEETAVQVFSDVSDKHWAKENIEKLAKKNILKGTADKIFEPDRQVTRAEFVKIVVAAFGMQTKPEARVSFKDCKVDDWYYSYIDAAVSNKIISGFSSDEFGPDKNILRQDAAVIIDNVLTFVNYKSTEPMEISFTDVDNISTYATQAVKTLVSCNVIKGMDDGSFRPKGELTRAEAATMIVNLLSLTGGEVSQ